MSNIPEQEKKELLSKILNSEEFRDSKRYQDLLKYLVEKSEANEFIKEMDIAIDVFGKDSRFDPSTNPLIRSYISNLRKKLEHYFLTTNENLTYKIDIPKGHYKVEFIPFKKNTYLPLIKKYWLYITIFIIILLLSLFLRQIFTPNYTSTLTKSFSPNPIWNEFIQPGNHSVTIILGDYIFFTEKNRTTDRIFIRNPKINNENDFNNFIKQNPEFTSKYEILKFTYLRPSSIYGLYEILRTFRNSFQNITIKLASEVQWKDFEKNNIIYIGTFKTLYKLDTLISKTNIRYGVEPSFLKIIGNKDKPSKSYEISWLAGNYQKDYSVIIKIQGYKNNKILFLIGFSEIGVMESVRNALDQKFVSNVEKFLNQKISRFPPYFEIIYLTEGVELTSFKSTIQYFNSF